jgi:hypothetical protein
MAYDFIIWVRLRWWTLWKAIDALREQTIVRHNEGKHEAGDESAAAAEEIRGQLHRDDDPFGGAEPPRFDETMTNHRSPHSIHARANGASVVQVEQSRLLPWLMVCSILSGIALAVAVIGFAALDNHIAQLRGEVNVDTVQRMFTNAWLARAGVINPDDLDLYNGPEGNVYYLPKGMTPPPELHLKKR